MSYELFNTWETCLVSSSLTPTSFSGCVSLDLSRYYFHSFPAVVFFPFFIPSTLLIDFPFPTFFISDEEYEKSHGGGSITIFLHLNFPICQYVPSLSLLCHHFPTLNATNQQLHGHIFLLDLKIGRYFTTSTSLLHNVHSSTTTSISSNVKFFHFPISYNFVNNTTSHVDISQCH